MANFLKLASSIDVSAILTELEANSQLWDSCTWRKDRSDSPHNDMQDIWLRYNDPSKIGQPDFNDEHDAVWYDAAFKLPSVIQHVFATMAAYKGERLGGVLITRIPPGGEIKPHIDTGWHVDYYDKFYLHLEAGKGAKFCYDDAVIEPEVGDLYWLDNSITHWVKNDSDSYRTTLIICIKPHLAMKEIANLCKEVA